MAKTENKALYYIRITGVLLIITMCTAFLLSFVNGVTKDVIAENEKKKMNEAISAIFTNVNDIKTEAVIESDVVLYKVSDGATLAGYYAEVKPVGFKGEISMLVGLDTEGKVLGVKILSHSETVGIGDAAFADSYISGFIGKGDSSSIPDAIGGATYSSGAVREGVSSVLDAFKEFKSKGGAL